MSCQQLFHRSCEPHSAPVVIVWLVLLAKTILLITKTNGNISHELFFQNIAPFRSHFGSRDWTSHPERVPVAVYTRRSWLQLRGVWLQTKNRRSPKDNLAESFLLMNFNVQCNAIR